MIISKILKSKGQILIETIIGVGVVAILLSAIIPLFIVGAKSGSQVGHAEVGRLLAQEEMEAAKALKEDNWNYLYHPLGTENIGAGNPYHLENTTGIWVLAAGAEEISLNEQTFTRSLIIDNVSRTNVNGAGEIEIIYHPEKKDPSTLKLQVTVSWPGSQGITLAEYFTRYQNSLWEQTDWQAGPGVENWQNPPGNNYFSDNQIDESLAGSIKLAKTPGSGEANFGNQFIANGFGNIYRLNNPNYRISLRFTANHSGNVNQLRVFLSQARNGQQIFFRYGLQSDVNGFPSGNFISSAIANFSTTGWQTINLPSPAQVTAGTIYHLVVIYDSGLLPSNQRYLDLRASTPLNYLIPQNMTTDNFLNTLRFDGSAWELRNQQPVYVLGFDNGQYEGNPYDSQAYRNIFSNRVEGEKFSLSSERSIVGVGLYLAKNNQQLPDDSLYVNLQDLTSGQTLVNEAFVLPEEVETSFAWINHHFASSITLLAGHQFSLVFSSPSSNNSSYFRILNLANPDILEFNSLNWDGIEAFATRSANGGSSFTDYNFIDLAYYLIVSQSEVYAPWGELISSSLDTGNVLGGGFNRLSFSSLGALEPETKIKIQLAANNNNSTWNFLGPNGTGAADDWYILASGELIWQGLHSNRYLRYKIRLETADNTITPILNNIKINWAK